ncbi:MAG: hypothetical protein ACFHWX_06565 [Bacteroidota bacterium]
MMRAINISLSVIIGIIFFGCEGERVNPEQESFAFYDDAQIVEEFPFTQDGEKVVFHHYHMAADKENVADDEYSEDVFFEVNASDEFYLEGDELKNINIVFKQHCKCQTYNHVSVADGYLKGDKKGTDRYLLEANVKLMGYYIMEGDTLESQVLHTAFTGLFKRSPLPAGSLN